MADPDIVVRLRESDGGFFMRQMFTESADEIERLRAERDEARREVCFLLSRNVTQSCDGDTPEFHATARGWCYLLEEDDE